MISFPYQSYSFNNIVKNIGLQIADIPLQLNCADQKLLAGIQQQYYKFIYRMDQRLITLDIHLSDDLRFPNPDGSDHFFNHQQFSDNCCFVNSNYFTGFTDIDKNYGKLIIDSENPLAWLEHFLRIVFAVLALKDGAILFHGAGIIKNGHGYIFFGPSGVGKSTVTNFSPDCTILGDDMIVLKKVNNSYTVYASPFNKEDNEVILTNSHAPIHGFYRLIQDHKTYLEKLNPAQGMAEQLACIPPVNRNYHGSQVAMDFCMELQHHIPCYNLHFTRDNSFWRTIHGYSEQLPASKSAIRFPHCRR